MASSYEEECTTPDELITIEHFPEIVLLRIFSHLSLYDICTNVALVCHRWKDLYKHPSLWQKIKFSRRKESLDTILVILKRAPMLRELSVRNVNLDAVLQTLGTRCEKLEKLSAHFCILNDANTLETFVANCPRIENLCLKGVTTEVPGIAKDCNFEVLSRLVNLRSLKMADAPIFDGRSLVAVAKCCINLENLHLPGRVKKLTDDVICDVVRERYSSLKTLTLNGLRLSDISLKAIAKCSHLSRIRVNCSTRMTDIGILALSQLTGLKELSLDGAKEVTSHGIVEAFSSSNLSSLEKIDLSDYVKLNDEALIRVVHCCCESLRWLSLGSCTLITNDGIHVVVQNCHHLKYLDLTGLQMTCEPLMEIPTSLPKLSYLILNACDCTNDTQLCEIYRQKRDLTIKNYFGCNIKETVDEMVISYPDFVLS